MVAREGQSAAGPPVIVFCPTRDRPSVLKQTLSALRADVLHARCRVAAIILVDDSRAEHSRSCNRRLAAALPEVPVIYHGQADQRRVLRLLGEAGIEATREVYRFVRLLGSAAWDLGAVRNYISVLSALFADQTAIHVCLDDDMQLLPPVGIKDARSTSLDMLCDRVLERSDAVVGVTFTGAPDISSLEAALSACRARLRMAPMSMPTRPVPISGGGFACMQTWLERFPFPRTYNEDWVWLLRCRAAGASLESLNVKAQHASLPRDNPCDDSLQREQLGEVICEGWSLAHRRAVSAVQSHDKLTSQAYWHRILSRESAYLGRLLRELVRDARAVQIDDGNEHLQEAIGLLNRCRTILGTLSAAKLASGAAREIAGTDSWRRLFRGIRLSRLAADEKRRVSAECTDMLFGR